MEFKPVLTKKDFVRRYEANEFGNRSPTWNNLEEMEKEQVLECASNEDLYHVRNRVAGGETWYNVQANDLANVWRAACNNLGSQNLYISQMAPTHRTTIQGEISYIDGKLSLYGTTVKLPMRDALKQCSWTVYGLVAVSLLRRYMDEYSYEWVQHLLDSYPDHVVEFSCYNRKFGTLNLNTVIWEVRKY